MSATYLSLHVHLVFSTKYRAPTIGDGWRERLHGYLGGTVRGLGGTALAVGGTADHVHLLVTLKSSHCLGDFMRELKRDSSIWVAKEIGQSDFAWQPGYGAFTVSPGSLDGVIGYIKKQEEHHRTNSSLEEFTELLKMALVPHDPNQLE